MLAGKRNYQASEVIIIRNRVGSSSSVLLLKVLNSTCV